MTARYAYLVIEPRRYAIDASSEGELPSPRDAPSGTDASGEFPDRLRAALDAAAERTGYDSLECWAGRVDVRTWSTPSRAEHVGGLLGAELLSEDTEVSRMVSGGVPDFAWEVLRQVHPDGGRGQPIPDPVAASRSKAPFIDSWSLALHTGGGVAPIEIDPARAPARTFPVALIAQTLEALSSEGWAVAHISEDRSIDDGASASTWSASGSCFAADSIRRPARLLGEQ